MEVMGPCQVSFPPPIEASTPSLALSANQGPDIVRHPNHPWYPPPLFAEVTPQMRRLSLNNAFQLPCFSFAIQHNSRGWEASSEIWMLVMRASPLIVIILPRSHPSRCCCSSQPPSIRPQTCKGKRRKPVTADPTRPANPVRGPTGRRNGQQDAAADAHRRQQIVRLILPLCHALLCIRRMDDGLGKPASAHGLVSVTRLSDGLQHHHVSSFLDESIIQ